MFNIPLFVATGVMIPDNTGYSAAETPPSRRTPRTCPCCGQVVTDGFYPPGISYETLRSHGVPTGAIHR